MTNDFIGKGVYQSTEIMYDSDECVVRSTFLFITDVGKRMDLLVS